MLLQQIDFIERDQMFLSECKFVGKRINIPAFIDSIIYF